MAEIETAEYVAFVRRAIRALGRRAAYDVDALAFFPELADLLNSTMTGAARDCHEFGYSWTDVARALGTTRQAAQKRFTPPPI